MKGLMILCAYIQLNQLIIVFISYNNVTRCEVLHFVASSQTVAQGNIVITSLRRCTMCICTNCKSV